MLLPARQFNNIFLFSILFLFISSISQASSDLNAQINKLAEKLSSTAKGSVVKGGEQKVYIDLGRKSGILPGNLFEVIRPGAPLKIGDQVLGYEETYVAKVKVTRTREKYSICNVLEKQGSPTRGDKAYQLKSNINTLVIGQFSLNNGFNALTKSLQEKLVTAMTNRGMGVVERDQLERVMREQKLGYSGLIDLNSAQKIGQLLGAQGIMLGTVSDLGNTITINARLVDISSGNAISASEVELHKTPQIATLLKTAVKTNPNAAASQKHVLSEGPQEVVAAPSFDQPAKLADIAFKTAQNSFLKAYAKSVFVSDDQKSVSATVVFENISDKDIYIALLTDNRPYVALNDNQGGLYYGHVSGIEKVYDRDYKKKKFQYYATINSKGTFAVNFVAGKESKSKKDIFHSKNYSLTFEFAKHKGPDEDEEDGSFTQFSLGLLDIPCTNCVENDE